MVGDSLSDKKEQRGSNRRYYVVTSSSSYEDIFNVQFPYYLSIGMTADQYWNGDCTWTKYFREAYEMQMEHENQHAWLQGMYIYDALGRLAPILRAMGKKGAKAEPYVSEPFPLTKQEVEDAKEKKERERFERSKRYMEAFAAKNNKYYEGK